MPEKKIPDNWYYDKTAGLVQAEGIQGYICRGIRNHECGYLLGAAPDLFKACKAALADYKEFCKTWGENCDECSTAQVIEQLKSAVAKAEAPPPKRKVGTAERA